MFPVDRQVYGVNYGSTVGCLNQVGRSLRCHKPLGCDIALSHREGGWFASLRGHVVWNRTGQAQRLDGLSFPSYDIGDVDKPSEIEDVQEVPRRDITKTFVSKDLT